MQNAPPAQDWFPDTEWTIVNRAADESDANRRGKALERLCARYWQPVYHYARRRGLTHHDAADAVQRFFLEFIEHDWVKTPEPSRGRFREFLLVCFKRSLSREHERNSALKRGGAVQFLTELDAVESALENAQAQGATPDEAYDLAWVQALMAAAIRSVEAQWLAAGKGDLFAELSSCIHPASDREESFQALAERTGMAEGTLRVAALRLRREIRQALVAAVRDTLADPDSVASELAALKRIAAG